MPYKKYLTLPAFILSASIFIFIFLSIQFWPFTADDTYIGLRYVENLISGNGMMIWNIGEAPVAGVTNFFWVMVQTIPCFLNLDPIIFSKILGILLTIGSSLIVFLFTKHNLNKISSNKKINYLGAAFAASCLLLFPASAVHSVSGMATALFVFLFIGFLFLLSKLIENPSTKKASILGIIALLFGLTRPEGNVIIVISLITAFIIFKRLRKKNIIYPFLLFYIVPGILYLLWRLNHFGFILPNSFYSKIANNELLAGKAPLLEFTNYMALRLGILILIGFLYIRKEFLPVLLSAAFFYGFYLFPAHLMSYNFRLIYPLSVVIFILAGMGLSQLFSWISSLQLRPKLIKLSIVLLVFTGLAWYAPGNINHSKNYALGLQNAHITLGKNLYKLDSTGSRTVAIVDAGAVPYFSKWRVIDTFGLNDNFIARSKEKNFQYILNQNPDFIVLISENKNLFQPKIDWEKDLYELALKNGMEKIDDYVFIDGQYHLWVMADPKNPLANKLINEHYNYAIN